MVYQLIVFLCLLFACKSWSRRGRLASRHFPASKNRYWTYGRHYSQTKSELILEDSDTAHNDPKYSRSDVSRYLRQSLKEDVRWTSLQKQTRQEFQHAIITDMKEVYNRVGNITKTKERSANAKYFSDIVYQIGKLGAKSNHLEEGFLATLWTLFEKASPNEYIGKTLYGLASMGIRWRDIPPKEWLRALGTLRNR